MEFLTELWLPIVLSAVIVFFASAVLWMALPLHKKDFIAPPDEASIQNAVTTHGFKPGQYYIPWCNHGGGGHKDPAFIERMKRGPWVMLTVMHQAPNFGRSLLQWFIYQLIICAIIAYAAWAAIGHRPELEYLYVFQVVGSIALLAQAGMCVQDSIWKGSSWKQSLTKLIDGVVYALLIAGVFAWRWPAQVPFGVGG